jgi:hypothetical protein
MPTMPASVPYKPRRGDWSPPQPWRDPLATEMEGGRTRPGDNVAVIEQTIRMTPSEYETFFAFVRGDLVRGTARFTWTVWLGSNFQTKTVEFEKPPRPGTQGAALKIPVAMTLRVYGV